MKDIVASGRKTNVSEFLSSVGEELERASELLHRMKAVESKRRIARNKIPRQQYVPEPLSPLPLPQPTSRTVTHRFYRLTDDNDHCYMPQIRLLKPREMDRAPLKNVAVPKEQQQPQWKEYLKARRRSATQLSLKALQQNTRGMGIKEQLTAISTKIVAMQEDIETFLSTSSS